MEALKPILFLGCMLATAPALAGPPACRESTPAVESMEWARLQAGDRQLRVRVAATERQRMAGMQRLCPGQIARAPILFLLEEERRAAFHMQNVHAPLDIAFIAADGRVAAVDRMPVGGDAMAPVPVTAVLEAEAGAFARWGLRVGDRVDWSLEERP